VEYEELEVVDDEFVRTDDIPRRRIICKHCDNEVWMDSTPSRCPNCHSEFSVAKKYNPEEDREVQQISETRSIRKQILCGERNRDKERETETQGGK